MIGYSDDAKMLALLAPLRRLEPVPFRLPARHGRWSLRRPLVAATVVAAALALAGVAIAAGFGAFDNISAAQHPQTTADLLPPATAAFCQTEGFGPVHTSSSGTFVPYPCEPDSSRLVATLPNGDNLYAVEDTAAWAPLCLHLDGADLSICGGVDATHPLLNVGEGSSDGSVLLAGVAMDGVTSVSFLAGGQHVSVPVTNNAWYYDATGLPVDANSNEPFLTCLTAHFADGSSAQETPGEACS